MTWEIVVGIIALAGFVGTMATYASKLAKTIATLETTVKVFSDALVDMRKGSKATHKEIFNKLEDHGNRICTLEAKTEQIEKDLGKIPPSHE